MPTLIFIISIVILLNFFVFLLGKKIKLLENNIIDIFKKRNNQIVSIYQIGKKYLNKNNEVFETFLELKRKDFLESSYDIEFKNRILLYKKIHNEINFIIKICEENRKMQNEPIYLYLKDSILEKSNDIGNKIKIYEKIKIKFNYYKKISNLTILGLIIK